MSADLTTGQNFVLGTGAALIEGLLLQPTLYWKTAKAQRLPFTLDPRLLYRGTGASIFNECQMMGIQFGLTGHFQKHISSVANSESGPFFSFLSRNEELLSAGFGGCFAALFASPVELVMIQQQLFGGRLVDVPRRIVRDFGFLSSGLSRAVSVAAVRDTIYVCGMLGVTPVAQLYLQHKHGLDPNSAAVTASIVGGIVAAVPSHPFDVIKTCMQGDLAQREYTTATETLKSLWRQGGLRRVFAGGVWRTVNIVATVYVANLCMTHGRDSVSALCI
eukprot:gene5387-3835_t